MEASDIVRRHKASLFPNVANYYQEPLVPLKAKGTVVVGSDGREYLDFFAGILTVSVGHCHPAVTEKVVEQQRTFVHMSTLYPTEQQVLLAEKLAEIAPFKDAKSFFTNSGTEADETAVVLAKVATGRRDLIALRHSYAGRGTLALNTMGQAPWRPVDSDLAGVKHAHAPYCYRCDFHLKYPECELACAPDVERLIQTETRGEIAAMLVEPILGVGGFITPPPEYFGIVSKIVRSHGGLMIADEVQTGLGRTGGKWWGSQQFPDFVPDIITSAKGLGNGQPIGATLAPGAIADRFRTPSLSTFGGNPISAVAARATIGVIQEERLLFNAQMMGQRLRAGLDQLAHDFPAIGEVRGMGLMQGVELVKDRKSKEPDAQGTNRVLEAARKNGLLVGRGGLYANVLRLGPPLVVDAAEVDRALQGLSVSLKEAFPT
jgi:4-aminobutyrate aminotransferase-like enzyme